MILQLLIVYFNWRIEFWDFGVDEFKPASIDKTKPGSLRKTKENRINVEFQNNQLGKPKVAFEGSSEDYKENDAVLFFDGETLRLERLHRAVKQLRHVRQPGESAAAACGAAVAPPAPAVEPRLSPAGKTAKPMHNVRSTIPAVPVSYSFVVISYFVYFVCNLFCIIDVESGEHDDEILKNG